ncbi:MAG: hypothetical protein ACD_60C00035G0005 [uncultured bacterium]|nr:MAG: hypothetical protein ACD_60C00035G0005 [uncultured bacterium]
MNELFYLQNSFQNYLINLSDDFKKNIVSTKINSAETRLSVYRNAYRLRLIEALSTHYPVLKIYLGCKKFEELAVSYLSYYPSSYRSIRWFGDQLPTFLEKHPYYEKFPYLSQLAQFEWTQTLVFDAKDSTVLQMDVLGSIDANLWGEMKFEMHPSLHRLELSWNVVQVWQMLSENQPPPDLIQSIQPVSWILWRKEIFNQFCSLTKDEAWAIDAIKQGMKFEEVCEGLCQWMDEKNVALHAASLLKGWMMGGLISDVTLL